MNNPSQEALVLSQFGARAAGYLTSSVHAQGEDLKTLAALTRGHDQARILDMGCGGGHVSYTVAPYVREVIAFDLSADMLGVVAQAAADKGFANIRTKQGTVEHLPFADHSFDFVFSRYSAHHWDTLQTGIHEAARVLKTGGTAIFIDVISPGRAVLDTYLQAVEVLRDSSHVRDFSRVEWESIIAHAGLAVTSGTLSRLHLEFRSWVERMATPKLQIDAIRALQTAMSDDVRQYFEIETSGSFTVDVGLFQTIKSVA